MNANVENTLTLRPDVVIAWQPSGAAQTLAPTLSRHGIPLISSQPQALDDIHAQILRFGKLFATEQTALHAARALAARIQASHSSHDQAKPANAHIHNLEHPLYT